MMIQLKTHLKRILKLMFYFRDSTHNSTCKLTRRANMCTGCKGTKEQYKDFFNQLSSLELIKASEVK